MRSDHEQVEWSSKGMLWLEAILSAMAIHEGGRPRDGRGHERGMRRAGANQRGGLKQPSRIALGSGVFSGASMDSALN